MGAGKLGSSCSHCWPRALRTIDAHSIQEGCGAADSGVDVADIKVRGVKRPPGPHRRLSVPVAPIDDFGPPDDLPPMRHRSRF
jgi:hypothetical protein